MYTCAKAFRLQWKIFLGTTIFVGIFSAVYEHYAHGIRSKPMIFAFLYPLVLGLIPIVAIAYISVMKKIAYKGGIRLGVNLYYAGIATLTFGSIARGVVEIYGTTNHLMKYYTIVGCPLLGVGFLLIIIFLVKAVNDTARAEETEDGDESDIAEITE